MNSAAPAYAVIAEFAAFVRRPKPLAAGLVARLYAENGPDADAVVALGRTAYSDALVDVALYVGDDEIGGFQAELRRPEPRRDGMVAQFFGENGDNADTITALGLGKFLDRRYRAVVRLVRDALGADQAVMPKGPHSAQAAALWKSSFFRHPRVWDACGPDEQFLDWITRQPSAHSGQWSGVDDAGQPRCIAAHVRRIANGAGEGLKPPYSAIPLTDAEHRAQHQDGESALQHPAEWWDRKRIKYVQRWAWETATAQLGHTSMTTVPPETLRAWARARGVAHLLPNDLPEGNQGEDHE